MKLVKSAILIMLASLWGTQVVADTVDDTAVTTFKFGTTLSSQAMNTTIGALISAINDNAARIDALEASTTSSVADRSYCINSMEVGFFLPDPLTDQGDGSVIPLGVERGAFSAGVEFVAGGSGTATVYRDSFHALFPGLGASSEGDDLGATAFTWTQSDNSLELTFDAGTEDQESFKIGVSNNGQIGLSGDTAIDTDNQGSWYYVTQTVAIEVVNATTCNGMFSP
ncbi:MAG: hypothetical protein WD002_11140 [Pseudomonadales bacterium]